MLIAAEMDCSRRTVGLWRKRFLADGIAGLQDAPRSVNRGDFPPSAQVDVVTIASSKPEDYQGSFTRWSLDDIAATLVNQHAAETMSRSTIWRVLNEADLKPHRSVYWLNSHDPDFDAKARNICQLYVNALSYYQQGRIVICCDEKTGADSGA